MTVLTYHLRACRPMSYARARSLDECTMFVPVMGVEPTKYTGFKPAAYTVLLHRHVVAEVGIEPTRFAAPGLKPGVST